MSNLSQVLDRVSGLMEGILSGIAAAEDGCLVLFNLAELQLEQLSFGWTLDESTLELETSAYVGLFDLIETFHSLENNDLKSLLG